MEALHDRLFPADCPWDEPGPGTVTLLAEAPDGSLVAYMTGRMSSGKSAYASEVAVEPRLQRRRIARRLLATFAALCEAADIEIIEGCPLSADPELIAYYGTLGFEQVEDDGLMAAAPRDVLRVLEPFLVQADPCRAGS